MRIVKPTRAFEKDFSREFAGIHRNTLQQILPMVIDLLLQDQILPAYFKDHQLKGEWEPHRECHLRSDLLLIYRKPDERLLTLVRLGSHSNLFG